MSDTGSSEPTTDLFDRWLAHHEGRPEDAAPQQDPPAAGELRGGHGVEAPAASLEATDAEAPTAQAPKATSLRPAPLAPRSAVRALPQTIFFKPRGGTQRVLGLLLLVFLALTAGALWWAYEDRSDTSYAIAGIAGVVTGIIWATRASATPTRLTLHGSELEIVRNGSKALFDLAHVQVEVHGTPGSRGWKVLILRRSMSPYVIDSSMVDPRELTYVIRFFHPEDSSPK